MATFFNYFSIGNNYYPICISYGRQSVSYYYCCTSIAGLEFVFLYIFLQVLKFILDELLNVCISFINKYLSNCMQILRKIVLFAM